MPPEWFRDDQRATGCRKRFQPTHLEAEPPLCNGARRIDQPLGKARSHRANSWPLTDLAEPYVQIGEAAHLPRGFIAVAAGIGRPVLRLEDADVRHSVEDAVQRYPPFRAASGAPGHE